MAKRKRARSERRRAAREREEQPDAAVAASADLELGGDAATVDAAPQPSSAKRSPRRAKSKPAARSRSRARGGLPITTIAWSIGGVAVLALLVFAIAAQGGGRAADPATEALARANAGTDVTVYSGRAHVVYQSDGPLPSTALPRADGQPTLVWFSAVWCEVCERMDPFAHATASRYTDRLVFVEKSIDEDRQSSSRYGVRGTPTFIMLDSAGREVSRFHGQRDAASFGFAIEQALSALEG